MYLLFGSSGILWLRNGISPSLSHESIRGLSEDIMSKTRVEIPQISNRRLGYLARIIRPVMSLTTRPLGRWPDEEVNTYFLRLPKDLRTFNFLKEPVKGKPLRLVEEHRLRTLHTPGSAGRVFHPTIAEVLAQIPDYYLPEGPLPANRAVAFETFLENRDPEEDESGEFHVATTVLLVKGSPIAGTFMTHYR